VLSKAIPLESKTKIVMSRISELLAENSSRPEIQDQIREAAVNGARDAGFCLVIGNDNEVKFGDEETYHNQDLAIEAAIARVKETVEL
jgi:hypothetical protein